MAVQSHLSFLAQLESLALVSTAQAAWGSRKEEDQGRSSPGLARAVCLQVHGSVSLWPQFLHPKHSNQDSMPPLTPFCFL